VGSRGGASLREEKLLIQKDGKELGESEREGGFFFGGALSGAASTAGKREYVEGDGVY